MSPREEVHPSFSTGPSPVGSGDMDSSPRRRTLLRMPMTSRLQGVIRLRSLPERAAWGCGTPGLAATSVQRGWGEPCPLLTFQPLPIDEELRRRHFKPSVHPALPSPARLISTWGRRSHVRGRATVPQSACRCTSPVTSPETSLCLWPVGPLTGPSLLPQLPRLPSGWSRG